jgi:hypothetical protein
MLLIQKAIFLHIVPSAAHLLNFASDLLLDICN